MFRAAAVIPAFNEARFLPGLLARTRRHVERIYVVDDGSTDDTAIVDAVVLRHDRNRGKGTALRTGFAAAIGAGFDAIVTLDGDGQHDPESIPSLLGALNHADLVIGRRSRSGRMPAHRVLSNGFSSALVSLVARRRIEDAHSGFRAYRASRLARLEIRSRRFEVEVELVLKAALAGWRIVHVPVPTIYGTERSKISPARDAALFLRAVAWHGLNLDRWITISHANGWSASSSRAGVSATRAF